MLDTSKYKILQNSKQKMKYFNYSDNSIKIYLHYIDVFLSTVVKSPSKLDSKDFQHYIDGFNFSSVSQQNQIISSIKFLYIKVLNKKYKKIDFSRPKNVKILPRVIDSNYLVENISGINNIKHRSILSLAYSVGLRVSEILNLKIEDIDSKRMIIHINNAKGRKDRVVPLSENILKLLRKYFIEFKPKVYLFNGQKSLNYSSTSCNKIIKKYLGDDKHMHLLRHSCFTHLLENGTDLRIIQKLAGHKNIKTTEIYTHVSTSLLKNINLPI